LKQASNLPKDWRLTFWRDLTEAALFVKPRFTVKPDIEIGFVASSVFKIAKEAEVSAAELI